MTAGCARPVRRLAFLALIRRYRLSERQIRRHLDALVRKGLLFIYDCYDECGRRTTYHDFDCTPFLQKIAALAAAHQSHVDVTDRSDNAAVDVTGKTDNVVANVCDRSDNEDYSVTDLSAPAVVLSSMTDLSTSDNSSFFSSSNNSNSKYINNYNNNYNISNSKHTHEDTFVTDVCMFASAEQVSCSAVVPATLAQTSDLPDIPQSAKYSAAKAVEQAVASKQYMRPGQPAEPTRTADKSKPVAKTKPEREPIQALLTASWKSSEAPLPMNGTVAINHISHELGDNANRSSRTWAHKLYRHLLQINQLDDEYSLDNPDLYFAELVLDIRERLRGVKFRCKNAQGGPNGMPLFFTELEREILQLVERVRALREQDPAELAQPSSYRAQQEKFWGHRQESEDTALSLIDEYQIGTQIAQYSFTDQQLADEMRRLGQPWIPEKSRNCCPAVCLLTCASRSRPEYGRASTTRKSTVS
ncbi:hypothetical protein [Dictyobacter vulcani]|uniref:hypothetical protein n=1 Tax=Dictyobacter vulcani TaxID=2607529 RepID=UPI001386D898|nr:hypothetical protein [Dictyobacter vulcani]